jgi:hypothetical protein
MFFFSFLNLIRARAVEVALLEIRQLRLLSPLFFGSFQYRAAKNAVYDAIHMGGSVMHAAMPSKPSPSNESDHQASSAALSPGPNPF